MAAIDPQQWIQMIDTKVAEAKTEIEKTIEARVATVEDEIAELRTTSTEQSQRTGDSLTEIQTDLSSTQQNVYTMNATVSRADERTISFKEALSQSAAATEGLRTVVAELAATTANLRTEMAELNGGLRAELAELNGGLRAELAELNGGLRAELAELHGGVGTELAELRGGVHADFAELRESNRHIEARVGHQLWRHTLTTAGVAAALVSIVFATFQIFGGN